MAESTGVITSGVLGVEIQELAGSWLHPEDACPHFDAVQSPSPLQSCEDAVDLPSS